MYCSPPAGTSQYADLAGLGRVLSRVEVGPLLALFQRKPGRGRPLYSRLPIIYALLASFTLNVQSIQALVDRLNNDPALRNVCGFRAQIPHRSTFSRSFNRMAEHRHLAYASFEELTKQIRALHPRMGTLLAVDASTVPAWANINRESKRVPEAGFTRAHSAQTTNSDGMVWIYGYKLQMMVCAEKALPLAFHVTPANTNESPTLPVLFRQAKRTFANLKPKAVMADRAYDGRPNANFLYKEGVANIIPRRQSAGEDKDGEEDIFNIRGIPKCMGGAEMTFLGTDPETGHHGFRCPQEGCHRRQEPFKGYTVCDDEFWEDPDESLYVVGGTIARADPQWQILYAKRWEVERYFSMLKNNHWIENHRFRGLARVALHITLGILMFQAAALDGMAGEAVQVPLPIMEDLETFGPG